MHTSGFIGVVSGNDIRMLELSGSTYFSLEKVKIVSRGEDVGGNYLDGDGPPHDRVSCFVDPAGGSSTKEIHEAILSEEQLASLPAQQMSGLESSQKPLLD
jgi:hypothetical protein